MTVVDILALAQPRFPGHRGIDLLQQESLAGVLAPEVDDLNVSLAQPSLF